MLVAAGFADPVLDQETLTLRWQGAEALARRAAPARRQRRARALRRAAHAGLAQAPASLRSRRAPTPTAASRLSIEIAYGHGFKPAPRLGDGAPVAVSLDDMRAMVRRPRPSR